MKVDKYPLGQMQANCYLLEQDGTALLIDPGDSADFLLEQILHKHLELVGIIATHGHFDHIMAVGEIQLTYPSLPLFIHPKDTFLLKRVVETAKHFLSYDPAVVPIGKTAPLNPGSFSILDYQFEVLHTPGHTPGSICLHLKKENILFSGDTIFNGTVGRYDFAYSDKSDLQRSIKKLLDLPQGTFVYSGHGEDTTIEDEIRNIGEMGFIAD